MTIGQIFNELIDVDVSNGGWIVGEAINDSSSDDFGFKGESFRVDEWCESCVDGWSCLTEFDSIRCIGTRWATLLGIRRTVNFFRSRFDRLKHEKHEQGSDSDGVNSVEIKSKGSPPIDGRKVPKKRTTSMKSYLNFSFCSFYHLDWANRFRISTNFERQPIEFLLDVHLRCSLLKILRRVNSSMKRQQLNQRE